jgi:hypothetical protein
MLGDLSQLVTIALLRLLWSRLARVCLLHRDPQLSQQRHIRAIQALSHLTIPHRPNQLPSGFVV